MELDEKPAGSTHKGTHDGSIQTYSELGELHGSRSHCKRNNIKNKEVR